MASTDEKEKEAEASAPEAAGAEAIEKVAPPEANAEGDEGVAAAQLGERRFVYAAYFGGGIAVAFLMTKVLHTAWLKLALVKPQVGEPRDDVLMLMSAGVAAVCAVYYWRRTRARQLAEEVAVELSKVTWPSKQEVTSSTTVVIVTTAVATVFFALMDRFWGFITNFVYGI